MFFFDFEAPGASWGSPRNDLGIFRAAQGPAVAFLGSSGLSTFLGFLGAYS